LTLSPGTKLGPYEILAPIGAGGMGEVYRARDTRLGREVAVKVLPQAFARNADRMARFEREARLLAALNHPNIATIHGLEESSGVVALVMELVEGPTLADRIAGGPIPLDEALPIVSQVAAALESAHEKGIIHRDLKPANIKVKPDGGVKVLDFGLAKALEESPAGLDPDKSPTISMAASMAGVVLGTAAYMSPEQARGKLLDKRTDIWAFGCVLFECLTGRRAFPGETATDTIAAVLEREPDWSALPEKTPTGVRRALRRCLQKDLQRRLRDIADARMEIEDALALLSSSVGAGAVSAAAGQATARPRAAAWRRSLPITVAVLVLALASALIWSLLRAPTTESAPAPVTRFKIILPPNQQVEASALALSPDGRELVFGIVEDKGDTGPVDDTINLFLHRFETGETKIIPGTELAYLPFFSPDGRWIGFIDAGISALKKVPRIGGTPQIVHSLAEPVVGEAIWTDDDAIICATVSTLFRIPADGGTPETLLKLEDLLLPKGEMFFNSIKSLPGTSALLLGVEGSGPEQSNVSVLAGGKRKPLVTGGSFPIYLSTGHLLYLIAGQPGFYDAFVAPFDLKRLELTGKSVPVLQGIRTARNRKFSLAVSRDGILAYASGPTGGTTFEMTWLDRAGRSELVGEKQGEMERLLSPRISPDGRRLLFSRGRSNADMNLFVYDLAAGHFRILAGPEAFWSIWTPNGNRVVYTRMNPERTAVNLYWKSADGSGPEERLTKSDRFQQPLFVTKDGWLVYHEGVDPEMGVDLWMLSLEGDDMPKPLLRTRANERLASLSPDGRFMAYVSDTTGREEVYVRPFPEGEGQSQVTNGGGTGPLWAPDGQTLFYRNLTGTRLFAVPVTWDPAPSFGQPQITEGRWERESSFGRMYDISPDGKRLIMISITESAGNEITVILNWFEELKRLVSSGKK